MNNGGSNKDRTKGKKMYRTLASSSSARLSVLTQDR